MISAQSYKPDSYTEDDLYLLELLGAHAAISIENARLFAKAQRLADIDPLTEAFSRRKFFELAEKEFGKAARGKKRLSVIMLDVDNFKVFNDRFGHKVGDLVLRRVADQCKSTLRDEDIFGRLGGEEFAVLLPTTTLQEATEVANRLRKLVEETEFATAENLFELATYDVSKREQLKVTVSLGVALCDESCKNIDAVIDHADRAMYSGKYAGGNQINVWKHA